MNLLIVLCLCLGVLVGLRLRGATRVVPVLERGAAGAVYLLVFLLGASVGVNPMVMENLGRFGAQALVLCVGGILGSLCLARLLAGTVSPSGRHEK